jgi:hypothetical protein
MELLVRYRCSCFLSLWEVERGIKGRIRVQWFCNFDSNCGKYSKIKLKNTFFFILSHCFERMVFFVKKKKVRSSLHKVTKKIDQHGHQKIPIF